MKATVVLIPRIEAQIATGETDVIDPRGVRFDPNSLPWPLFANHSYRVPEDVLGWVRRIWMEHGQLMAEIDIDMMDIGYAGYRQSAGEPGPTTDFHLLSVSLIRGSTGRSDQATKGGKA